MRIAIPTANGALCPHFGHCDTFTVIDIGPDGAIATSREEVPPPHEPGVLPAWLASLGVEHVVAGGMGMRAQDIFRQNGITVTVGVQGGAPGPIAESFANGTLTGGENICDH